jgi:hypothetical protein
MPIALKEGKTPKGERCLVAHVSGHVSLADAQGMGAQLEPGQPFHLALVINLVDKNTDYSPESRKYFVTMKGKYKRMATVVSSPVVRAGINFMVRLSGGAAEFRLFDDEPSAMAWLDRGAG